MLFSAFFNNSEGDYDNGDYHCLHLPNAGYFCFLVFVFGQVLWYFNECVLWPHRISDSNVIKPFTNLCPFVGGKGWFTRVKPLSPIVFKKYTLLRFEWIIGKLNKVDIEVRITRTSSRNITAFLQAFLDCSKSFDLQNVSQPSWNWWNWCNPWGH